MKKILVVEDTQVIREEICDILQMENFEVSMASNGYEGLIQTKNMKPDLIISDIMMPVLDGYQFVREIKKSPNTENIPIIFLSAKAQKTDIRKGMNRGVEDYITKPIHPTDLLTAVNMSLEKQSKLDKKIEELRIKPIKFLPKELIKSLNIIVGFSQNIKMAKTTIPDDEIALLINSIYDNGEKINSMINDYLIYLNLITKISNPNNKNISLKSYSDVDCLYFIESAILSSANEKGRRSDVMFNALGVKMKFNEFYFKKIIEEMLSCVILCTFPGDEIKVWSKNEKNYYLLFVDGAGQPPSRKKVDNTSVELVNDTFNRSIEILKLISKVYSGKFEYNKNNKENLSFTYYFEL